ncbi:MAG: aspartate/tyrosine/aromatic aminotransferase [Burkholderiales bacterium]|nr:aspartate/tyrosine/aromatic aminotransferase [Burkholderiales bacterium]MCA3228827.1 aspartate/tyrosine/aromatic aminotransferase [Burkholderiales bacterium]
MTSSPFSTVELAPRDPILGLTETFLADPRGNKVNLGVGVYYNDEGKVPLLRAVKEAERLRVEAALPRGYLPIEGIAAYDAAVQALLFGADSALVKSGRLVTAQALGGTGALRIGADFLRRLGSGDKVLISDPSWENHRALFENAGFKVETYPYYDAATRGVRFDAMLAALRAAAPGTTVVLHACCHNPTGVDLTEAQWRDVVAVVRERGLISFLDIAYQGFGDGIDADGFAVRLFGEAGLPLLVASSFSKSFSLYGERVGALTVVTADRDEAARVLSQLKRLIRTNYSTPPTHGASLVAAVLTTPALRATWEQELGEMRDRIKTMRTRLAEGLKARGVAADFGFILRQRGMFSYSGLTAEQVARLQKDFGVYAVSSGRICVAALNSRNIEYACDGIAAVLKG